MLYDLDLIITVSESYAQDLYLNHGVFSYFFNQNFSPCIIGIQNGNKFNNNHLHAKEILQK